MKGCNRKFRTLCVYWIVACTVTGRLKILWQVLDKWTCFLNYVSQLIRKFITRAQRDFIDLPVCDSSAGIDLFNGKTEVMLILQTRFENIVSYEFPYNDNKMIMLMNTASSI